MLLPLHAAQTLNHMPRLDCPSVSAETVLWMLRCEDQKDGRGRMGGKQIAKTELLYLARFPRKDGFNKWVPEVRSEGIRET